MPEDRDTRYDDSPFKFIKAMGAKQKGKYYELITEDVLRKLGYNVSRPVSTDHDRVIDGVKTEIKGSSLMKNDNRFTFLQIRPAQDYEELMFTMCYPDDLVIMKMDKATVVKNIENKTFAPQHGGQKGNSGTFMYYGNAETLAEIGAVRVEGK
jgi:hypothetical protein